MAITSGLPAMLLGDPENVLEDGEVGVGKNQGVSQEPTTLQAFWATTLPNYTLSPAHYLQCHLATEAGLLPAFSFSVLRSQSLLVMSGCLTDKPPPIASQFGWLCGTCCHLSQCPGFSSVSLLPLLGYFSHLGSDSSLTPACFSFSFWFIIKGS